MACAAALRKAAVSCGSERTQTKNLLPYDTGFVELKFGEAPEDMHSQESSPWRRPWILKYGGSSVGQRLPRVCESIFEHIVAAAEGHSRAHVNRSAEHQRVSLGDKGPDKICVVVSAMGKTTDMLLDAAQAAHEGDLARANDFVAKIHDLALCNAKLVLEHYEVPESIRSECLKDVACKVDETLNGLADYLKGVFLLRDLSPRTLDAILSHGERVSATVVALVLQAVVKSVQAPENQSDSACRAVAAEAIRLSVDPPHPIYVDATKFLATDESFGCARVDFETTFSQLHNLVASWPSSALPIFSGFIGRSTSSGATTTLGRNGSDYSAAIIGAALKARQVIINTDVPGVFTADPRLVPDAFPVPQMSYIEAIELSIYGSKIFHPKTMFPLIKYGVPMVIRNTNDTPGAPSTVISDPRKTNPLAIPDSDESGSDVGITKRGPSHAGLVDFSPPDRIGGFRQRTMADMTPRDRLDAQAADAEVGAVCIASLEDLSFITVRAEVDESDTGREVAARATLSLKQGGVSSIWSDQRSGNDACILVRRGDCERAVGILRKAFDGLRLMEMSATEPVTLLSLVPKEGASRVAAASRFFEALSLADVKIYRVVCGASTASISCLIDAQDTAVAVRTAHEAFNFFRKVVSLVLLGNTPTAQGLLEKIQRSRAHGTDHQADIRICGVLMNSGSLPGQVAFGNSSTTTNGGAGKSAMSLEPKGLCIQEVLERLSHEQDKQDGTSRLGWCDSYELVMGMLPELRRLPRPVLVDCMRFPGSSHEIEQVSSDALTVCYLQCLQRGIRLVVSNSSTLNVFANSLHRWNSEGPNDLNTSPVEGSPCASPSESLHLRYRMLRYDSAVAAGMPLLETIRDLVQAGRKVSVMQGSISASIGYILDRVGRDQVTLREAAAEAYRLGVTEPHLATDLTGLDVLEKLRVIAFACGCELPDHSVQLQPVVSREYFGSHAVAIGCPLDKVSTDEILKAVECFDKENKFSERVVLSFRAGRRWRYVSKLELHVNASLPEADQGSGRSWARASVGLEEVDEDHFAFPIRGLDIACALWEDPVMEGNTGKEGPIVVLRGQGAGQAAGDGVLSDVVRLVGM